MPTVFLADPDPAFRRSLGHALRQRGVAVEEFGSGSELYARAITADPDLIVMETDLDEMDGFQVFARLQAKRPDKPVRVLFVTEFDHPRVARICKQRGALGYVGKGGSVDQVLGTVLGFLSEADPLQERKLPAAIAWLQSRGKSGRLTSEAGGETGYVLLHKGKVLEARWGSLEGDQALAVFADELADARFRFAEGADELDLPDLAPAVAGAQAMSAEAPPPASSDPGPVREAGRPAALVASEELPGGARESAASVGRLPRRSGSRREPSEQAAVGGAVAAARELHQGGRAGTARGLSQHAAGIAAAVTLVLLTGLAIALLFPGAVPPGIAGALGDLGIATGERDVREPVPQLARTGGPAHDLAAAPGTPSDSEELDATEMAASEPRATFGSFASPEDTQAVAVTVPAEAAAEGGGDPTSGGPASGAAKTAEEVPERSRQSKPEPAREAVTSGTAERRLEVEEEPAKARRPVAVRRPPPARDSEQPRDTETVVRSAPRVPVDAPAGGAGTQEDPDAREVLLGRQSAPGLSEGGELDPSEPRSDLARPAGEGAGRTSNRIVSRPVLLQRGADPYYPPELRAQGVTGSVVLNIRVGTNGRAQRVEIARSSGYEAFDQAAVATVGTFLWDPARDADGPTEAWITQAVTFRP